MSFKKIFIILFLLSAFPAFAQSPTPASTVSATDNLFLKLQDAAKPGKTTLERWSEDSITSSAMTIQRSLIGEVPKEFFDQLSQLQTTGKGKFPKLAIGGAIGSGTQMIASLFTPPASGIQYIASTWDNVLGKPAYAQGYGFNGLQFLLPLWKAARNIVYILSSIVFVVIGLMIILRVKISPQAVVTIQSAVPAVITTLILVTFSYAIAGLLIDAGNLILGVILSVLFNAQGKNLSDNIVDAGKWWSSSSGFPIISDIFNYFNSNKTLDFKTLANPDMGTLKTLSFLTAPHWISLMLLGGMVGSIITGIFLGSVGNIAGAAGNTVFSALGSILGGGVGGLIGAIILPIIFSIIVGIWLIKLYFGLIKTYVTIIFKVISAPIEIFMGAFPNSKMGFSSWVLDIFANIMVFPIVTIFLVIITIITDAIMNTSGATIWAPGLIWYSNSLYTPILAAAVGMAGLALVSKLPDLIPQYIFMIKPSPFGQAIGQNLDTSLAPISKFAKGTTGNVIADSLYNGSDRGLLGKMLPGVEGFSKTMSTTVRNLVK